MPTRTLAQLREEVRQTADIQGATTWITDAEVNRYLNSAISEWWDLLLEAHGQEYFLEEYDFETVSGTAVYDLDGVENGEFYVLKGVDLEIDGVRQPISPYNLIQRNMGGDTNATPYWYRLQGSVDPDTGVYTPRIRLQPTPDDAYTIHVLYVPAAPVLDDDADVWHGQNGWEEYIVVTAAIRCLIKEESDTTALELRKAQLEQRIRNVAGDRDWSRAEVVTDEATMGPATGGPASGVPGGGGSVIFVGTGGGNDLDPNLLWEWNGVDTTQFDSTFLHGAVPYTGSAPNAAYTWTPLLTVQTDADVVGGRYLRLQVTGTGSAPVGGAFVACLINADEVTLPLRYTVRAGFRAGIESNRTGGFLFYGGGEGSFHAYGNLFVGGGWRFRFDGEDTTLPEPLIGPIVSNNGTTSLSTLVTQAATSASVEWEIDGDKEDGVEPRFIVHQWGRRFGTSGGAGGDSGGFRQTEFVTRPVPATWLTVDPRRFGIAVAAPAAGTPPMTLAITSLRIFKHPRDRQP